MNDVVFIVHVKREVVFHIMYIVHSARLTGILQADTEWHRIIGSRTAPSYGFTNVSE